MGASGSRQRQEQDLYAHGFQPVLVPELLSAASDVVISPDPSALFRDFSAMGPSTARYRQRLRGHAGERESLAMLGDACATAGLIGDAEDWYEALIALLEEDGANNTDLAEAMAKAGDCLRHYGHLEAALRWHKRATEHLQTVAHPALLMKQLYNTGHIWTALNKPDKAIRALQEALDAGPTSDHRGRGRALRLLGHCHRALGRLEPAEAAYRAAIAEERHGDRDGLVDQAALARCLDQLGDCVGSQGRHTEALRWHREALAIHAGSRDAPLLLAGSLLSTGRCLRLLGEWVEARQTLRRAEALLKKHASGSALHQRCKEELALCRPPPPAWMPSGWQLTAGIAVALFLLYQWLG